MEKRYVCTDILVVHTKTYSFRLGYHPLAGFWQRKTSRRRRGPNPTTRFLHRFMLQLKKREKLFKVCHKYMKMMAHPFTIQTLWGFIKCWNTSAIRIRVWGSIRTYSMHHIFIHTYIHTYLHIWLHSNISLALSSTRIPRKLYAGPPIRNMHSHYMHIYIHTVHIFHIKW